MAFRTHQSEIRVALSPSVVRSVLIGLLLFNVGCHDDLKAEIEGVYRIDMSRVSAELSADKNMMQAQRWTFNLGQRMLQPVRYGIKDGACWRGVAGARKSWTVGLLALIRKSRGIPLRRRRWSNAVPPGVTDCRWHRPRNRWTHSSAVTYTDRWEPIMFNRLIRTPPALRLTIAVYICFGALGCSGEASFLAGEWYVDLEKTLAEYAAPQDLKLGDKLDVAALRQGSTALVVRFERSNTVHITHGKKSIRRTFDVVKAKGTTVALSIKTGPKQYRRVIASLADDQLALVDSHQRIVLSRR